MGKPDNTYRQRQEEQLARFLAWTKDQPGAEGHELPVTLPTLLRAYQLERLDWIKSRVVDLRRQSGSILHPTEVLEVGCSWGFVTAWVRGTAGLDINPANVMLARVLNPGAEFRVGDARKLPYQDQSFDILMLPEVLEHLPWADVPAALREAARVARKRVLITVPDGEEEDSIEATSFKHPYLVDHQHRDEIVKCLTESWYLVEVDKVSGFICILAERRRTP